MATKYVDVPSIVQVIGTVYNNPSLLELTDKYTITDDDFPEEFHKIVFGAIYKIYELGANKITLENIADFLSSRPKAESVFKAYKGNEWLLQASENAIADAFDYYYNRMKKMSLLRAFERYGIDVTDIYNPDNILDSKLKQQQEEWLDNSSLEDIANKVNNKIETIRATYVDNEFNEAMQAGDGAIDLIDKLKNSPEVGVPLYGNLMNTVTRGARLKKFFLRSAPTGAGKAIPNYTIIPTPNGWRRVDEIKVGDYLFGATGKPVQVLAVHPQPKKKFIWKVFFSTGTIAECCEDHLWAYRYMGGELRVDSIKEMYRLVQGEFQTTGIRGKGAYKLSIPMLSGGVEYPEKAYTISPYNIGLQISSKNQKIKLKSIPEEYKNGSVEQRKALLNGILDGQGGFSSEGCSIRYLTTSLQLAKDIRELCFSLGHSAKIRTSVRPTQKVKVFRLGYYIDIFVRPEDKLEIFRDEQKKQKVIDFYAQDKHIHKWHNFAAIKNIVRTNLSTWMTCFTVDSDDGLFLMNDFIVTHNTRSMIADSCHISCNKKYDEVFGWIKNGTSEPTLYISTEQDKEEIQTMMLAFLSNVNEEHILSGRYEGDEEDRVREAARLLKEAPLYIELLPDFSLQDIEDTIKRNIREHNVKYVFDPN